MDSESIMKKSKWPYVIIWKTLKTEYSNVYKKLRATTKYSGNIVVDC